MRFTTIQPEPSVTVREVRGGFGICHRAHVCARVGDRRIHVWEVRCQVEHAIEAAVQRLEARLASLSAG